MSWFLEGLEDLISGLITPITHIVTLIIPLLSYLLSPPDPPNIVGSRTLLFQSLNSLDPQDFMLVFSHR